MTPDPLIRESVTLAIIIMSACALAGCIIYVAGSNLSDLIRSWRDE